MFVTPNCSVKPTAASARIDAVTRPKPTDGTKTEATTVRLRGLGRRSFRSRSSRYAGGPSMPLGRFDLLRRIDRDRRHAVRFHDLERARRVPVPVEGDLAHCADVLDLL